MVDKTTKGGLIRSPICVRELADEKIGKDQLVASREVRFYESSGSESDLSGVECSPSIDEKALLRRIDLRVLPMLFIVYTAAFLDR